MESQTLAIWSTVKDLPSYLLLRALLLRACQRNIKVTLRRNFCCLQDVALQGSPPPPLPLKNKGKSPELWNTSLWLHNLFYMII